MEYKRLENSWIEIERESNKRKGENGRCIPIKTTKLAW